MECRDVAVLKAAIEECRAAGLPEKDLQDALMARRRMEQMLARLGVAVQLLDLGVLAASLEECRMAGLPERDLDEAAAAKAGLERLLAQLRAAIEAQDLTG